MYLDGTIQFEAKLTGMLYTRAVEAGSETNYGALVSENLNGMVHEHYFNVRLDMSVDGDENTVVEVEAERVATGEAMINGVDISDLNQALEWADEIADARSERTAGIIRDRIESR